MGTVYLVRHAQASFGAADYDRLSDLGRRQCQALGVSFRGQGIIFDMFRQVDGSDRRGDDAEPGIGSCDDRHDRHAAEIGNTPGRVKKPAVLPALRCHGLFDEAARA